MATISLPFSTAGTTNWTVPSGVYRVNLLIVGGGGSGAPGFTNTGGSGGRGGAVATYTNVSVTPGAVIPIVVGAGGAERLVAASAVAGNAGTASSFISATYSAAGGAGGLVSVSGSAGAGGTGSGGAGSPASGVTGGNGGPGTTVNGTAYGVGGGGGCGPYDRNSTYPVLGGESPGPGDPSPGDGARNYRLAQAGNSNTGRGGGGGRSNGETYTRVNPANLVPGSWGAVVASSGAAGGSGVVIVTYEESEHTLSLFRDNPTVSGTQTSQLGFRESGTVTIQLKTTNVPNGTVLPYTISGTGITAADFSPATLTGSFAVDSTGTASVTLNIAADVTAENNETATISLDNGLATLSFNIGDFSRPALTDVAGIVISILHYNDLRTKIAELLGTGAGSLGYGQPVRSSPVDDNTRVRWLQWDNLRYDIFNAWKHQFGTLPTIADVRNSLDAQGAGNIVRASSTAAPYDQYNNFVNILTANSFGIHSSQAITRNGATPSTPWIKTYTSSWTTRLSCTVTVTWPTADAARFFFNSGGEIRFFSEQTGGAGTPQNTSWSTLLTGIGTLSFGGQLPGAGLSPANGQNYHRLSSTPTAWATKSASSPYGSNVYTIKASTLNFSTVTFLVEWTDGHVSINGSPDTVDGTIELEVTTLEASGLFEPAGSGSFTVTSPTITLSNITVS